MKEVWRASDSTGGAWQPGQASYSAPRQHLFLLEAEPTSASQYQGYAAVDNWRLAEGSCGPADCNFDAAVVSCGWEDSQADTPGFDWSVGRGSLKSFTGPTRDESSSRSGSRQAGSHHNPPYLYIVHITGPGRVRLH